MGIKEELSHVSLDGEVNSKMAMGMAELTDLVLNLVLMVLGLLFMGGLGLVGYIFYAKWKRYNQFTCVILYKDMFGQSNQKFDKAGVFVDGKTNNKRFFMKNANVGLEPDNIPYVPCGGKNWVYLIQTGLKNFRFVRLGWDDKNFTFKVGEEDVNWSINTYEGYKKKFGEGLLHKILPLILYGIVIISILVIIIYIVQQFTVLKDVSENLVRAAEVIARGRLGTTIVPGNSSLPT